MTYDRNRIHPARPDRFPVNGIQVRKGAVEKRTGIERVTGSEIKQLRSEDHALFMQALVDQCDARVEYCIVGNKGWRRPI